MRAVHGLVFTALLLAAGCGEEKKPAPKAETPAAPACELTLDNLAGRTFVHVTRNTETKGWDEDILARARFFTEDGALKVKYNTRALADMYTYTCGKSDDGAKLDCKEGNPRTADYCRSLIANGKECTVEEIVRLTGATMESAEKGVKEVQTELKKLPKKEFEDMKKVFNSPNNQLRGMLHVKIKEKDCNLLMEDQYETIAFKVVREMQNVVGTAYFRETKKDYVFEHCKDDDNLVALEKPDARAKPGQSKRDWKVGDTVPFRFVGPEMQRAESGCNYTMDTWLNYEPLKLDAPVTVDGGKLDWSFAHVFPQPSPRTIMHMYRYKQCGADSKKLVSVSCQGVKVD